MNVPHKRRLDRILTERGIFSSRNKAQAAIMSGSVFIDNLRIDKPGKLVSPGSDIRIKEKAKYVGRGGLKLETALSAFNIKVRGKTAVDIGASTGGFTDCLLQNGAVHIYAVDAGYGQLDISLRNDRRVTVMEKTNARYLTAASFAEEPAVITIDVSFISLSKIFPAVGDIAAEGASVIALIKPQFEAERKHAKKGVVTDPAVHEYVIKKIRESAVENNLIPRGIVPSPILGPKGNREFLLYMISTRV